MIITPYKLVTAINVILYIKMIFSLNIQGIIKIDNSNNKY